MMVKIIHGTNKQYSMKKNLFALVMALLPWAVNAEVVEVGGIFYSLKPAKVGTASVTFNPKDLNHRYKGDVVIPQTIESGGNTYSVTEIDQYAFMGCNELTSVTMPQGITTIGVGSFEDSKKLTSINIPSSVTEIKSKAFYNCDGLKRVDITNVASWCGIAFSDYGNPLYYAQHLFADGKEVTDLTIPDDVIAINSRAFNGFAALKSVNIGKGVKTIGSYAFAWCSSLTSITLPEQVESMGGYVFVEDTSLVSVSLSRNCPVIDAGTFQECKALQTIVIPDGVKHIAGSAFRNCSGLKRVYLSASVEKLSAGAFTQCGNLTDVYCYGTTPATQEGFYRKDVLEVFLNSYVDYSTLHVPESAIDSYRSIHPWSEFGKITALTADDTAVEPIPTVEHQPSKFYTLGGMTTAKPTRGITIVKQADGKVKKIFYSGKPIR